MLEHAHCILVKKIAVTLCSRVLTAENMCDMELGQIVGVLKEAVDQFEEIHARDFGLDSAISALIIVVEETNDAALAMELLELHSDLFATRVCDRLLDVAMRHRQH